MSSGENKTLLAQLVEHWTGIAEVMDSIPYRPEFFFRPYSHYCLSSVHYCEDHFHICFLFVCLFFSFKVWLAVILVLILMSSTPNPTQDKSHSIWVKSSQLYKIFKPTKRIVHTEFYLKAFRYEIRFHTDY